MEFVVSPVESGMKLIDFLRHHLPSLSARQIKRSIEQNGCLVNGRAERFASQAVGRGDRVQFLEAIAQGTRGEVLFEDTSFLFFNKPPGEPSEVLLKKLQQSTPQLQLVHRLDKETSGVLLLAKSKEMFEAMVELFKEKKVAKEYLALVDGSLSKAQGFIENQLGKVATYQGQTLWGEVAQGLYARTEWQIEKAGQNATLLRCFPITGRTHQLRVHLSSIGHPILGDGQYGRKFRTPFKPRRCMLHAEKLKFTHPATGEELAVKASLPKDFVEAMQEVL